jgi:hypothetical protein
MEQSGAPERRAGRRDGTLATIAFLWVLAASQALSAALHSPWPAPPEVPTADQVHDARTAAWVAAAVAVMPLLGGLLLAARWRRHEWAIGFGVVLMFAVLGSGLLVVPAGG